jgi:hypothetical protein
LLLVIAVATAAAWLLFGVVLKRMGTTSGQSEVGVNTPPTKG